jgi:hypothetical protein
LGTGISGDDHSGAVNFDEWRAVEHSKTTDPPMQIRLKVVRQQNLVCRLFEGSNVLKYSLEESSTSLNYICSPSKLSSQVLELT